jgi:hypothetical protein
MEQSNIQKQPDLVTTVEALKSSPPNKINSAIFYGLSNLSKADVETIRPVWHDLAPALRRKVVREMVELSETNYELEYRSFGLFALSDDDPGVREAAIEVLWEDASLEVMSMLIQMAQHDPNREVRAAATSALGRYILMGELGDLPESETRRALDAAVSLYQNVQEDVAIRRRALEAMANSSHSMVPGAIQSSYRSADREMRISSVFAMGRTCDDRWEDVLINELESDDAEMRYEAVRAAGELELASALPLLSKLIGDDDREIQMAAIWALGEIGGREAMRLLTSVAEYAEEEDDEDLLEAVEDALGSASFVDGDMPSRLTFDEDDYTYVDDAEDDAPSKLLH